MGETARVESRRDGEETGRKKSQIKDRQCLLPGGHNHGDCQAFRGPLRDLHGLAYSCLLSCPHPGFSRP